MVSPIRKLLEILSSHTGPISCLSFSPSTPGQILSGSWDKTLKVWDLYSEGGGHVVENIEQSSDVTALAYRPDGGMFAFATLNGNITFWDVSKGVQVGYIEGRNDIRGGRSVWDKTTAKSSAAAYHFVSLSFSPDGSCVLAASNSKYICIYHVKEKILLKQFQISSNRSLDGVTDFLNSKNMTESGNLETIDDDSDDDDIVERKLNKFNNRNSTLPGVASGDKSKRSVRPVVRSKCAEFASNARAFAAATTEGLMIFSLDDYIYFDPFDLDLDITPNTIFETLQQKEYLKALVMSMRLNENDVIFRVYESIPYKVVSFVVKDTPVKYLNKLLNFIATQFEKTAHFEFHLIWVREVFKNHGRFIKDNRASFIPVLRSLQKATLNHFNDLSKICDDNLYTMQYLVELCKSKSQGNAADGVTGDYQNVLQKLKDNVNENKTDDINEDEDDDDEGEWLGPGSF